MNEYDLACSVSHHFRNTSEEIIDDATYEEREKQRLMTFPKHERELWCWVCGFVIDPCDFKTPREGVEAFESHLKECEDGWREISFDINDSEEVIG